MDEWLLSTRRRLFDHVFRLQQKRWPEEWEQALGLALLDDSLKVERVPEAEELRRVHFAALGARAALGIFK